MSRRVVFKRSRSLVAGLLLLASLLFPSVARGQKPIFEQDLEPFGLQLKELSKNISYSPDQSTLTFLSDNLLLVAIHELGPCRPVWCPPGTTRPPASLLLFNVGENKLIRQTQKAIAPLDGSIQATQDEHFLLPDGTGVQLCSAEFRCSDPLPIPGPVSVSPRGTRAIIGGTQSHGQVLIDTATLSVLKIFAPDDPFVVPGDNGLLLVREKNVSLALPGEEEHALEFTEPFYAIRYGAVTPYLLARFLNDHEVIGYTEVSAHGFTGPQGNLTVKAFDGKILASLPEGDEFANEFAASASGSRVWMHQRGEPGLDLLGRITEKHLHDFVNVQVFDTNSGKRVFRLEWDPEPYPRTAAILPALSPGGHRLALIRKSVLQVYEIP